jgi:phenylacetate-CoA ligase
MPFEAGLRWERYRVAAMRIMGRRFRFREVLLTLPWGSAEAQRKALEDMKLAPSGIRVRRVVLRLDTPVPETLRVINQFAPDALGGYSSYIEELLAHVRSSVERLQAPRVAFCYSEGLSGSGERLLAEFGIAPIRSYGAVEAPDIGFECERHSGLHLNVDTCPIRLVDGDGRDVPPGERGEVVVSQLTNRATILLNYRLGDLTALLPGRCTCGRNLPLAAFIEGRVREWALTPRGPIHALVVRALLKDDREVRRYQITQLTPELFRLALVVAPETRRTELAERLARRFREHLGSWAQIEVDYVDDLPRTPAGKTPGFIPLDAAAAPRA